MTHAPLPRYVEHKHRPGEPLLVEVALPEPRTLPQVEEVTARAKDLRVTQPSEDTVLIQADSCGPGLLALRWSKYVEILVRVVHT